MHWNVGEGIEEGEFSEAALEKDYSRVLWILLKMRVRKKERNTSPSSSPCSMSNSKHQLQH